MELPDDFNTFLADIRPTKAMRDELKDGHTLLRERLRGWDPLKPILMTDFLQGSYRRFTSVRPSGDQRSDVDVIIVTRIDEDEYAPGAAMDLFVPFLDKYYKGKWQPQGRSFGIAMSRIDMDLVITSAPADSEIGLLESDAVAQVDYLEEGSQEDARWRLHPSWLSEGHRLGRADAADSMRKAATEPEWKASPLRIPDREAKIWEDTHPLEQILWTRRKNKSTNGHFTNVVKAVKWWRLHNYPDYKHPKGFPLERLVGEHCPNDITSVAEGVARTLEAIRDAYRLDVLLKQKPFLKDYGVPTHDVLRRLSANDFAALHRQATTGADIARRAFDSKDRRESNKVWRELLGPKFPPPPDDSSAKNDRGFTSPDRPATPGSGRFA